MKNHLKIMKFMLTFIIPAKGDDDEYEVANKRPKGQNLQNSKKAYGNNIKKLYTSLYRSFTFVYLVQPCALRELIYANLIDDYILPQRVNQT